MRPVVVIDPGHGGRKHGTAKHGIIEKDYNLDMAERVREKFADLPIDVHLLRDHDETVSFATRGKRARDLGADFVASIHVNASPSSKTHGGEAYHQHKDATGKIVGEVFTSLLPKTLTPGRVFDAYDDPEVDGDEWLERPATVLNPHESAVLFEVGYASNPRDRLYLQTKAGKDAVANAIQAAIIKAVEFVILKE